MVYDNGSQVVKMTILGAQSRPSHATHGERGHVERLHREIHLRVHLRAIGIAPPKSFNVKAQHLERASATCEHRSLVFPRQRGISLLDQSSLFGSRVFVHVISTETRTHTCPMRYRCSKIRATLKKSMHAGEGVKNVKRGTEIKDLRFFSNTKVWNVLHYNFSAVRFKIFFAQFYSRWM